MFIENILLFYYVFNNGIMIRNNFKITGLLAEQRERERCYIRRPTAIQYTIHPNNDSTDI